MAGKYDEQMVALIDMFGKKFEGEIPRETFNQFYAEFVEQYGDDISERSLASKMRHMGFKIEKKAGKATAKSYTEAEEAKIRELAMKEGVWMEDIADALGRDTKSIGGKLISMGIYGIKKKNKKVNDTPKMFSAEDEATILEMIDANKVVYIEDLADALGKSVKQVRGKLAGMRIKGVQTRNKKAAKPKVYTDELVAEIKKELAGGKALEDIAKERGLNFQGMRTTLTRLGVIEKKGKKVFWTPERIKQLEGLATKGATLEEAADALGTTIMVVGKRAKADGLELKKEEKAA
jgi:predicted transcriptional regulator